MSKTKEAPLTKRDETMLYIAEEIRFLDIVLIHPASSYTIDPDLEHDIYRVQDNRLYNPFLWKDPYEYYDIFYENIKKAIEEAKGTVLMIYNQSLAICTGHFHDLFSKRRRNPVSCLYFYNNDEDLASVCPESADFLVSESNAVYNEIAQYPHIKKIEVPVGFKINFYSLLQANDFGDFANVDCDHRFAERK
jgi:hypothetical protein